MLISCFAGLIHLKTRFWILENGLDINFIEFLILTCYLSNSSQGYTRICGQPPTASGIQQAQVSS